MLPQPYPAPDTQASYMPKRMHGLMSQVATVASQPVKGENAVDRWAGMPLTDMAIRLGEGGVPLPVLGPWSYVAGVPLSFEVARRDFKLGMDEITNEFRGDIAQLYNIPEQAVTPQLALMASQHLPGLQASVQAMEQKKGKHPLINASGLAGMAGGALAGGTLAALLMASNPLGWVVGGTALLTGMAGGMAGQEIGRTVLGDDEKMNPMAHLKEIKEARQGGQPITAKQIFGLRVAMNPELNKIVSQQYGANYFRLDEGRQIEVMRKCEGLTQSCMADAAKCTLPETNVNALMFGSIQDTPFTPMQQARPQPAMGAWAQRVGGPQQRTQGGFAQRVQSQRMHAAAMGPQV